MKTADKPMTGCELNLTSQCVGVFNELQQNADIYCGMFQEIQDYILDITDTLKENSRASDAPSYIKNLREFTKMFSNLITDEEDEL